MKHGTHVIKDTGWYMFKNSYALFLIHVCPNQVSLDQWFVENAHTRFQDVAFDKPLTRTYCGIVMQADHEVAAWDYKGLNYYCPRCDKDCPQEVEDLALLANCHRRLRGIAQRHKYMVEKPDEYK